MIVVIIYQPPSSVHLLTPLVSITIARGKYCHYLQLPHNIIRHSIVHETWLSDSRVYVLLHLTMTDFAGKQLTDHQTLRLDVGVGHLPLGTKHKLMVVHE